MMVDAQFYRRSPDCSTALVGGCVLGMSQAWYIGVLARKIEPEFGGDIGFELAAVFAGIVYPIARYIEKKKFGR